MRILSERELVQVSGGKSKTTPVGPKGKSLPEKAEHGQETAAAASNKPKKKPKH